jgi:hypothetical protein
VCDLIFQLSTTVATAPPLHRFLRRRLVPTSTISLSPIADIVHPPSPNFKIVYQRNFPWASTRAFYHDSSHPYTTNNSPRRSLYLTYTNIGHLDRSDARRSLTELNSSPHCNLKRSGQLHLPTLLQPFLATRHLEASTFSFGSASGLQLGIGALRSLDLPPTQRYSRDLRFHDKAPLLCNRPNLSPISAQTSRPAITRPETNEASGPYSPPRQEIRPVCDACLTRSRSTCRSPAVNNLCQMHLSA